jgi:hypothetical protein
MIMVLRRLLKLAIKGSALDPAEWGKPHVASE